MTAALAIFVKTPGLSPIKTRLAASIGARAAIEFHRLSAGAVAQVARSVGAGLQPYWAVAESGGLGDPLWRDFPKVWQGEGGLGERLHRVYAALRARHGRVLLVGADAPQVTRVLLQRALDTLRDEPGCIIGAARDGGFWLFGGNGPIAAETWTGVVYSRADTAMQLRHALGARVREAGLPALTDVDRADDLGVLAHELAWLPAPTPKQCTLMRWLESPHGSKATESGAETAFAGLRGARCTTPGTP